MNLKKELIREHSKRLTVKIINYVSDDQKRFDELLRYFFSKDEIISSHAAWAMSYCGQEHPQLLKKHLPKMISNLKKKVHPAIKRNTMRVMEKIEIPEKLQGKAFEACLELITSANETIAVKAFAMGVAANICKEQVDLIPEFKMIITSQEMTDSPAIKNRIKKILLSLNKTAKAPMG